MAEPHAHHFLFPPTGSGPEVWVGVCKHCGAETRRPASPDERAIPPGTPVLQMRKTTPEQRSKRGRDPVITHSPHYYSERRES